VTSQPAQSAMPCERPPVGWWCSLTRGHDGPCPTHPATGDAETVLRWLVDGHRVNGSLRKDDELTENQKAAYAAALEVLKLPDGYMERDDV
jgi:hypothetical protein